VRIKEDNKWKWKLLTSGTYVQDQRDTSTVKSERVGLVVLLFNRIEMVIS
jgi:hypothetical protein